MTPLALSELTTTTLNGTGIFDVLMRANKAHLQAEFDKGRIKGPEYASVYLGSLQAVMQAALSFLAQRQKIDLEAQLLVQQIALVTQQRTNLVAEALNIPLQGTVLVAQECKLRAEFDNTKSATLRSAAEITLLNQKTATERSQVTALGVDADSTVGRQKSLYLAQSDGFKRAAEQKAADVMVSAWNVQRTTDDLLPSAPAGLDGANILLAVNKLLQGVGAK